MLTIEQINNIHYWWCQQLETDNRWKAVIDPVFRSQIHCFSAHLYELLHLNHAFLEINLKMNNGISLSVCEKDFQPSDSSLLAIIFNLALKRSQLSISAFRRNTHMFIDTAGSMKAKIELQPNPPPFYNVENMLFWNSATHQHLPVQALPESDVCFDPLRNIDIHMERMIATFNSLSSKSS